MSMRKPIISFLHLWVSGWPTTWPQGSRYSQCRECPFPQNNTNCDWNSKNEIRLPYYFERVCSPSKNEHSHPNKHEKQPKFFVTALHCVSDCLSSRVTWLWWRWTRWKLGQMSDVKKSAEFNWKCKDVFIPWWSHTILKKWAPNCNMFKSWVKTWRPIERLASLKILMILAILRTCSRKL